MMLSCEKYPKVLPYLTVFAPTDAAFASFLMESGSTAEQILASPALRMILANHVIAG
jgi:uncharacterized surface protein with fasciclin (FAS1) repeats